MQKKRTVYWMVALWALLAGSVYLEAHNGMEHVMGTVTAVTETSVTVDTVQHKSVTVLLQSSTQFTHQSTPASSKDLQVGDRVVIHAKLNPQKKLVGVTVKWGAGHAGLSARTGSTK